MEYRASLALAQQCMEIATELGDPGLLLEAHHALWGPYFFLGEYDKAFAHTRAGLAIYDLAQHEHLSVHYGVHDAGSCALCEGALALWNMGFPEQARSQQASADALAQRLTLPANIAEAYGYAGLVYQLLREPRRTQEVAQKALQLSNEIGSPYPRILSAVLLGWSLAMQGQVAEGLALARQGMDGADETGLRLHYSQLAVILAEILMAAGRHEEAVDALGEGIRRFELYHDLLCAADLWMLRGDALRALNAGDDEVEECYQRALALARRQSAQVSALRAATHLVKFQHEQGGTESRQTLQEIYDWFTEGHDTPDLRAAADALTSVSLNPF